MVKNNWIYYKMNKKAFKILEDININSKVKKAKGLINSHSEYCKKRRWVYLTNNIRYKKEYYIAADKNQMTPGWVERIR